MIWCLQRSTFSEKQPERAQPIKHEQELKGLGDGSDSNNPYQSTNQQMFGSKEAAPRSQPVRHHDQLGKLTDGTNDPFQTTSV